MSGGPGELPKPGTETFDRLNAWRQMQARQQAQGEEVITAGDTFDDEDDGSGETPVQPDQDGPRTGLGDPDDIDPTEDQPDIPQDDGSDQGSGGGSGGGGGGGGGGGEPDFDGPRTGLGDPDDIDPTEDQPDIPQDDGSEQDYSGSDDGPIRSERTQELAERGAERLREETGRDDIQADDITVVFENGVPQRFETNERFKEDLVAEKINERRGTDFTEDDLVQTTDPDEGPTLTNQAERELAAEQFEAQRDRDVDPDEVTLTDDGAQLQARDSTDSDAGSQADSDLEARLQQRFGDDIERGEDFRVVERELDAGDVTFLQTVDDTVGDGEIDVPEEGTTLRSVEFTDAGREQIAANQVEDLIQIGPQAFTTAAEVAADRAPDLEDFEPIPQDEISDSPESSPLQTADDLAGAAIGATVGQTEASFRALAEGSGATDVASQAGPSSRALADAAFERGAVPLADIAGDTVDLGGNLLAIAQAQQRADPTAANVGGAGLPGSVELQSTDAEQQRLEDAQAALQASAEDFFRAGRDETGDPTLTERATTGLTEGAGQITTEALAAPETLSSGTALVGGALDRTGERFRQQGAVQGSQETAQAGADTAVAIGERTVRAAQQRPFRTVGSLLGSAAIMGGAARISPAAGGATRFAIQPGEEIAGALGNRALPGRLGERLFPDNEPLIFSEEAAIRAGQRLSRGAQSQGGNLRRLLQQERAQGDFGRLVTGSETDVETEADVDQTITSSDLADVSVRVDPTRGGRFGTRPTGGRSPDDMGVQAGDIERTGQTSLNFRSAATESETAEIVTETEQRRQESQKPEVTRETTRPELRAEDTSLIGAPFQAIRASETVQRQQQAQQSQVAGGVGRLGLEIRRTQADLLSEAQSTFQGADTAVESQVRLGVEPRAKAGTRAGTRQGQRQELDQEQELEQQAALETELAQETEARREVAFEPFGETELRAERGDGRGGDTVQSGGSIGTSGPSDRGGSSLAPGFYAELVSQLAGVSRRSPGQSQLEEAADERVTTELPTAGLIDDEEAVDDTQDFFGSGLAFEVGSLDFDGGVDF